MSEQPIPSDIMSTAEETLDLICCNVPEHGDFRAQSILDIARALLAERQKHDRPASPDLQAEAERVFAEPELTCPHIDRAVASGELSEAVIEELAIIREINSQLRYGTWCLKAQLADAKLKR